MLNLDTHIIIYSMTGELRPRERQLLESNRWAASAISLWEIAKLEQLGRISIELESKAVRRFLGEIRIWPIDLPIATQSTRLDFTGDPADEIIAATSVVHQIPLVTRDQTIRKSRIVPLA